MQRTKIKGTKVRRTPTEEPNFYDPAWKGHFGSTIPEFLKKNAYTPVAPPPQASAAKKQGSPRTVKKAAQPATAVVTGIPYVNILPAPQSKSSHVPVSDEESSSHSLDSTDLDAALEGDLLLFEGNPFHFLERDHLGISSAELEAVLSQDHFPAYVAM